MKKVYKLYFDTRIEAKNAKEAEDTLFEQNGAGKVTYFSDEQSARQEYERLVSGLGKPMDLSGGLKWYEGVILECGDADNDEECTTLEEVFLNAYNYDTLAWNVRGEIATKYEIMKESIELPAGSWSTDDILDEYDRQTSHHARLVDSFDTLDDAQDAFREKCEKASTWASGTVLNADVLVLCANEYDEDGNFDQGQYLKRYASPARTK